MRHIKPYQLFESYEFDKSLLNDLIKNARKWKEDEFIEEYVDWNDIGTDKVLDRINKGDTVELVRKIRNADGKYMYGSNGMQLNEPYKTVIADKDYYSDIWKFIMDNTQELQDDARIAYKANKNTTKPKFDSIPGKTVKAYHASPKLFKKFERQDIKNSGQIGADIGFFFFTIKGPASYYASTMDPGYIYEVELKIGNQQELIGEEVGTNVGRQSDLIQAAIEGYDSVLIKNADTGYGFTDEIIMFDDDNIKILKVTKV